MLLLAHAIKLCLFLSCRVYNVFFLRLVVGSSALDVDSQHLVYPLHRIPFPLRICFVWIHTKWIPIPSWYSCYTLLLLHDRLLALSIHPRPIFLSPVLWLVSCISLVDPCFRCPSVFLSPYVQYRAPPSSHQISPFCPGFFSSPLYFPRGPERKSRPPFVIAFPSLFPTFVFVKFVPQVHPYMIFPVVQYLCLHYSSSYSKPLFFSWNRSYPFLDFVVRRQCNFTSILPPSVCNLPILFVFRFHFLIVHLSFDWGFFFPRYCLRSQPIPIRIFPAHLKVLRKKWVREKYYWPERYWTYVECMEKASPLVRIGISWWLRVALFFCFLE